MAFKKMCSEWGFPPNAGCAKFKGTFQECRNLCTEKPSPRKDGKLNFKGQSGKPSKDDLSNLTKFALVVGLLAVGLNVYNKMKKRK